MKYTVRRHGNNFKVYEVENKRYIITLDTRNKANRIAKNLNSGGGFEGDIPKFMVFSP